VRLARGCSSFGLRARAFLSSVLHRPPITTPSPLPSASIQLIAESRAHNVHLKSPSPGVAPGRGRLCRLQDSGKSIEPTPIRPATNCAFSISPSSTMSYEEPQWPCAAVLRMLGRD
jgi:hypothetical protein